MPSRYRVLYVDDEPALLDLTRLFLEKIGGFSVDCALSGSEALDRIAAGQYDAVVSDFQMPGMDGIMLLKKVREARPALPFILFTGRGREEVVVEAINSGVDFYLQKGGDPQAQFVELSHKIRTAIERRTSEKALRESEEQYRSLVETTGTGYVILDKQGRVITANQEYLRLTGLSAMADIEGKQVTEWTASYDLERNGQEVIQCLKSGKVRSLEIDYRRPDGTIQPVEINASVVRPGPEEIVLTLCRDITERRRIESELGQKHRELTASYERLAVAEEELKSQFDALAEKERTLRLSEERLLMAQEIGHTGAWEYSLETGNIWGSAEASRIYGYPPVARYFPIGEIEGRVEGRERTQQAFVDFLEGRGGYDIEIAINPFDGSSRRIVHSIARIERNSRGTPSRVFGVIQDITGNKQAEEALRESEELLRTMIEQSPLSIQVLSPDGRTVQVNHAFVVLFGATPEDLENYNMLGDEQLTRLGIMSYIRRGFAGEALTIPAVQYETGKTLGFGETKWVLGRIYPVRDTTGTIRNVVVVHEDISEQKKAEESLRASEERYRVVAEFTRDWEYWLAPDGIFRYISPSCERITGYRAEEFMHDPGLLISLVHADDRTRFTDHRVLVMSGKTEHESLEFRIITKTGEVRWIDHECQPVHGADGKFLGIRASNRDITDRKRAG